MQTPVRICAAAFAAIALTMLATSVAATVALAHGGPTALRTPFLFFCHGLPEHSLSIDGVTMPLCARCVGIYAGMLLGIIYALVRPGGEFGRLALSLALTPMLLDGFTQALGLRTSTNPLRLATGIAAGAGFLLFVLRRIERGEAKPSGSSMTERVNS